MRYLFVDATNLFYRYYSALPSLDLNGNPIGGVQGTLHALKRICEITKPDSVVVVFDGEGGSQKRREIYKEYKNRSKPIKIKANYLDPKDAQQNLYFQFQKLTELLECLPIQTIRLKNVECDDVIAYLCGHFSEHQKIVASGDKDFYQLLNDKTVIYCPSKKTLKTKKDCIEEFSIHPKNFAMAKSIVGDKSDNIKGVPGIGFKTLTKLIPEFENDQKIDHQQLLNLCTEKNNKIAKIQSILNSRELVIRNFDLIQLENSIMGATNIERIKSILGKQVSFNQTNFRVKLIENRFPPMSESFFDTFLLLSCRLQQQH